MTDEAKKNRKELIKQLRSRAERLRECAHRASSRADMDADMRAAWELDDEANKLEILVPEEKPEAVEEVKRQSGRKIKSNPSSVQLFNSCMRRTDAGVR